jgi:hypothetical protein
MASALACVFDPAGTLQDVGAALDMALCDDDEALGDALDALLLAEGGGREFCGEDGEAHARQTRRE